MTRLLTCPSYSCIAVSLGREVNTTSLVLESAGPGNPGQGGEREGRLDLDLNYFTSGCLALPRSRNILRHIVCRLLGTLGCGGNSVLKSEINFRLIFWDAKKNRILV